MLQYICTYKCGVVLHEPVAKDNVAFLWSTDAQGPAEQIVWFWSAHTSLYICFKEVFIWLISFRFCTCANSPQSWSSIGLPPAPNKTSVVVDWVAFLLRIFVVRNSIFCPELPNLTDVFRGFLSRSSQMAWQYDDSYVRILLLIPSTFFPINYSLEYISKNTSFQIYLHNSKWLVIELFNENFQLRITNSNIYRRNMSWCIKVKKKVNLFR
jgi:hypothetical protein